MIGGITCEHLNKSTCAFAVSSTGTRCVLEKRVRRGGMEEYTCGSSEIEAERLKDWIETDQCIESCGLDRNTLGISSDGLLDSHFVQKLCSPQCYQGCPNIADLYFNLAAGEGIYINISYMKRTNQGKNKNKTHVSWAYYFISFILPWVIILWSCICLLDFTWRCVPPQAMWGARRQPSSRDGWDQKLWHCSTSTIRCLTSRPCSCNGSYLICLFFTIW